MVLREMPSALASRMYTNGAQQSASGAVFPDAPSSIPNIGAEFLGFTSKSVEVWPNLPILPERSGAATHHAVFGHCILMRAGVPMSLLYK
jgi:hypothetical protein